jgi:hypothetical protein
MDRMAGAIKNAAEPIKHSKASLHSKGLFITAMIRRSGFQLNCGQSIAMPRQCYSVWMQTDSQFMQTALSASLWACRKIDFRRVAPVVCLAAIIPPTIRAVAALGQSAQIASAAFETAKGPRTSMVFLDISERKQVRGKSMESRNCFLRATPSANADCRFPSIFGKINQEVFL